MFAFQNNNHNKLEILANRQSDVNNIRFKNVNTKMQTTKQKDKPTKKERKNYLHLETV